MIESYNNTTPASFESNVVCYRIVVAALTNNEKRHLTAGDKWYPVIQFCRPKDKNNCWGNVLVGTIESEGVKYCVIGGCAHNGVLEGLGYFHPNEGVSYSYSTTSFRSVSSKEIASTVFKDFLRVGIGFITARTTKSSPLVIPPSSPPA